MRVAAVGLSVTGPGGHRGLAYASSERVRQVEDAAHLLGEGPSTDSLDTGIPVLVPDFGDPAGHARQRWPGFVGAAERSGFRAALCFPVRVSTRTVGAATLYHDQPRWLDLNSVAAGEQLADMLSLVLLPFVLDAASAMDDDGGVSIFRARLYQAAGMLSEQVHISIDEAVLRLRASAYAAEREVFELADDVVCRRVRFVRDDDGDIHPKGGIDAG